MKKKKNNFFSNLKKLNYYLIRELYQYFILRMKISVKLLNKTHLLKKKRKNIAKLKNIIQQNIKNYVKKKK
ncbi:50S ribosomal protein L29 [Candidatus Annandia adelgestsuga]|uniref:Large ribosomal subunit protein uL29 n=1 Tax=Candidatus Annandia adelgestsuga TaxID=1302411 RepID=A0A3S9J7G4_9ENTR|nr:50S ribosomal protein L29 [Candidatus Annandia adelgestsuga]AZP36214.1 50S ribosomal protein L29 [Candidatus Annandia adelgestsuga]